jgi:hypothetical protein
MKNTIILLILTGLFGSCYYDNREELYPVLSGDCDTTSVTYSLSILPVMQTKCYACHNTTAAPSAGAGIVLEGYANLKTTIDNGRFQGAVNHQSGFSPMPKNGGKLDDCSLQIIEKWINAGYPEN